MPGTALIVDDEEIVRNYVRRALASRGWTVLERSDGASAVSLAGKEEFDLLICDLKMPDMRGEEAIRRIRELRPSVRIIVITGSVSNLSGSPVSGMSISGYLIKPFGIDEIRDLAEKALSGK
ncbi:MAG TPA: response regulator [Elusimicrobiales bacterium]|nr:response regulator [Elusimicrobiales bacterium]